MQPFKTYLLPLFVALAACGDPPEPATPEPTTPEPATPEKPLRVLSAEALAERQRIASKALARPGTVKASLVSTAEVNTALDLPAGVVASASLTSPNPQASMVAPSYGNILPRRGSSLFIMSTGNINVANLPEPGTDYPPAGAEGDKVTYRVTLNVPDNSNRVTFDFRFLSAESPEYIGTQFNDTFTARALDGLGTRTVADASVNSAQFFDVSSTRAAGTGYDTLFADDPSGVDYFPATYPPEIMLFPDAGITDFRTVNFEVMRGGQTTIEFEISDLGDGVLDSAVIIDNITFTSLEVVDPNPNLIRTYTGAVDEDPLRLTRPSSDAIPPVQGVAADGVTQVLVRTKVSFAGSMTFSLSGTSPANGGLGAVGTSTRAASVTVPTVLVGGVHHAFALYTSPPDFNTGGFENARTRSVTLSGAYTPESGVGYTSTVELSILRPPLVLVHDVWSSCSAWQGTDGIATSELFNTTCANYSETSSASLNLKANDEALPDAIQAALTKMRQDQNAVTQVDVVAHGAGGLLTRKYIDWANYRSSTNFMEGDINRLISLNTPHEGTRMATELVRMRDILKAETSGPWELVRDALAIPHKISLDVDGGSAIDDLKVGSALINNLRQTDVPTHFITGQGAQPLPRTSTLALLPDGIRVLYQQMETYHPDSRGKTLQLRQKLILGPDSTLFCNDPHDIFAGTAEQQGGTVTGSQAITPFTVALANRNTEHFKVQINAGHRDRILQLLNSPVGGPLFVPSIPRPSTVPTVNSCAGFTALPPPRPAVEAVATAATGTVVITSPQPGTVVSPGGKLTVSVAGAVGFQPETVLIMTEGAASILESGPFTTTFKIPAQALGSLTLVAFGIDSQGRMVRSTSIPLTVSSSAQLSSIQLLNGDAFLRGPGAKLKLVVNGKYSDGVVRDISSPSRGTLYSVSNTSIATITADGTLTGVSKGMATVMVRNGTVLTSITVSVGDQSPASCIPIRLGEYNLFVLEDYQEGNEIQGKLAAGRNITLQNFSVGEKLPATDTANALVAGGTLSLANGYVWGDARYGGKLAQDSNVFYPRGTVARATPINFTNQGSALKALSAELGALPSNGVATRESWGGVMLTGKDPKVNVFDVKASYFTGATLLSITAPANSLAVINIRGKAATFTNFGHAFSGGIDEHGVLFNLPDATALTAFDYGFYGTVLAPNANVTFSGGSWVGGIYARSLKGNAVGQLSRLRDTDICD
ncbi:choice-of-anchor A family protein [Corallococcus exiguus]|uniref:Choice-of-anchor A family protein n=1 Tax=Corallococcus exiguus TaxID=83462 RepID=A0A7X4YFM3_9BACT|nr:choice-of-anchor A family protein [Corallococcus exiguus]NBC44365.1 choice-of-anchor A family protein [Corallococcus exiguus]TNV66074.1 choice-of-anchor A family protein [Corallococcus exiguus]